MKTIAVCWNRTLRPLHTRISALAFAAAVGSVLFSPAGAAAQTQPAARIHAEISSSQMTVLPNSKHPLALAKYDAGRVSGATKLQGMSIHFGRTPAQEAKLQALLAAQQNPASPQYHQWLTPDQFAAQFGVSDSDIAKVQSWLEQQGFSVDSVNRSRNMVRFSGTAAQAEQAFSTEIHAYNLPTATGVERHFAPSTNLSVPSALAGVVLGISNLDNFRPKPHIVRPKNVQSVRPNFTSSQTGSHFMTPLDVATVYDIGAAYNAGYTGTGQSIAVVGQSAIAVSDIENFQNALGMTVKDPTQLLVPGSGSATISTGDESESDLDLEYSGAIAKGATIYFVYTGGGSSSNYTVWDSIQYAVDADLAPVISTSYGTCETDLGATNYAELDAIMEQGTVQGQTIVAAAGDDGSTDCYGDTNLTTAQQETLAVDYPASSAYVTGMGGTEFPSADVEASNTTYWASASGSTDVISSALSYIPEQVWNDDVTCVANATSATDVLCSGGGGVSTLTARPSWQTGTIGGSTIASGSFRMVPDLALDSSGYNAGYLFCSSDSQWTGVTGSCSNGFRDSTNTNLTTAGGTSFAAPIFSGMVAILNQKVNSTGQGLINSTLYTLAANSGTYASAFHDITGGSNGCTAGSTYCSSSGESGFSATAGYDEASGLGSVDFNNLLKAWPANAEGASSLTATTTTVTASNTAPTTGDDVTYAILVAATTGSATPAGTVSIGIDGSTVGTVTLSSGVASYTTSFSTTGSHVLTATYEGNSTFSVSSGSVAVTISATSSGTGSFTLGATNLTVSQGSSGASTITVTPAGGYTGTVFLTFDTSNDSALQNLCYDFADTLTNGDGSVSVTGTSKVTTQLTFYANAADCATTNAIKGTGKVRMRPMRMMHNAKNTAPGKPGNPGPLTALAGLLLAGFLGRYAKKLRPAALVLALVSVGFGLSGCGGSSSNTISNPPTGTYTITLAGQDSNSTSITASTTFTLTIQ